MNWTYFIFDTLVLPAVLIAASLIAFKFKKYIISMVCTGALLIWTSSGVFHLTRTLVRFLSRDMPPEIKCTYPITICAIVIGVGVIGYSFYGFYKAAKYHGFESLK